MAFQDKAIPSRPFIPGATTIRDRDGADLTLNQNEIYLNTLGDVSSILITAPSTVEYPNNNFTTLNPPPQNTITSNQSTSDTLVEDTSILTLEQTIEEVNNINDSNNIPLIYNKEIIPDEFPSVGEFNGYNEPEELPIIAESKSLFTPSDFTSLFDTGLTGTQATSTYQAIDYSVGTLSSPQDTGTGAVGKSTKGSAPSSVGGGTVYPNSFNYTWPKRTEIKQIVLHYTQGWDLNGQSIIKYLQTAQKSSKGKPYAIGIHYALGFDGKLEVGNPESDWVQASDNYNKTCIAIEISSVGPLTLNNGVYKTTFGSIVDVNKANFGKLGAQIIDLGYKFNGSRYFNDFNDDQYKTLETWLNTMLTKYPEIKNAIQGKSVWKEVFGISKPSPGGNYVSTRLTSNIKEFKLTSHCTEPGGTHVDCFPAPKLVSLMIKLGMKDI